MTNRLLLAAAAAAFVVSASGAALALPVAPLHAVHTPAVTKVTFWGKPFPYGYAWRARSCSRLVTIETSRGPVTRRVYDCSSDGRVVSYRG
jgi:hypothetical protein